MAIRYPYPWEGQPGPERRPDTDPRPGPVEDRGSGAPGAEALAARLVLDQDPHRRRRGSGGAADALYRESQTRGWGMSWSDCRARVNRARATCAAKRNS